MSTPHYTPGGHWMPSFPGRVCASCGKTFTAHGKNQNCCSRTCAGAHRRAQTPKKEKACAHCGKMFEIPNGGGHSRKKAAMYCSRECVRDGHGWKAPTEHTCDQCGKPFTAAIKNTQHRFCSHACTDAHRGAGKVQNPARIAAKYSRHRPAVQKNRPVPANVQAHGISGIAPKAGKAAWSIRTGGSFAGSTARVMPLGTRVNTASQPSV